MAPSRAMNKSETIRSNLFLRQRLTCSDNPAKRIPFVPLHAIERMKDRGARTRKFESLHGRKLPLYTFGRKTTLPETIVLCTQKFLFERIISLANHFMRGPVCLECPSVKPLVFPEQRIICRRSWDATQGLRRRVCPEIERLEQRQTWRRRSGKPHSVSAVLSQLRHHGTRGLAWCYRALRVKAYGSHARFVRTKALLLVQAMRSQMAHGGSGVCLSLALPEISFCVRSSGRTHGEICEELMRKSSSEIELPALV